MIKTTYQKFSEFVFVTNMLSEKACVLVDDVARIKGTVFVGAKEISRKFWDTKV